jgi:hypothetical protein
MRLNFDAPKWIALALAVGGSTWAVLFLFATIWSVFDPSSWGLTAYLACGYTVFFWWIYRWRRRPRLRTSISWWWSSFVVNSFFLFWMLIDDASYLRLSGKLLDEAMLLWWISASASSGLALGLEFALPRP